MLPSAQGNALGDGVALIKVLRSERATFFMRGNAPCDVIGGGYALGARGILALRRQNADSVARCIWSPRAMPWADGNIWAFSPPHTLYEKAILRHINKTFCLLVEFSVKCLEGTTERSDDNRARSARIGYARTMCLEGTTPQDVLLKLFHRRTAFQAEPM